MQWTLSEEQELMRKTAQDLVTAKSPVARVRELRDQASETGFSMDLWKEMAQLGLVGASFPEELGGSGLGFMDLCIILEQAGRELMPEPFVSTVLLGAQILLEDGNDAHLKAWMGDIIAGEKLLTLAHQERRSRYNPCDVQLEAAESQGGFVLRGEKIQVLDGHVADGVIVSARTRGERRDRDGVSLFLVDPKAAGVEIVRQVRVDGRNAAIIRFDGVTVGSDALVGELHQGLDVLNPVLDRACIGLAAEMLGGASKAFDITLAYLKERKQFGVPIGSFQALQHRATKLFCELELCRSIPRLSELRRWPLWPRRSVLRSSCTSPKKVCRCTVAWV